MAILSSARLQSELIWLKIVAVFAAITGLAGVYIGGHTDSSAIILDAMYSLICMIASIFLVIICYKIEKPANEHFHFGYYKFEPAMVALEAVLIIASCLLALISAFRDIMHTSALHNYLNLAASFQLILAAANGVLVLLLWIASKKLDSQLLLSQMILWLIDGLLSLFLGIAFLVAIWLQKTVYAKYVPYIDPILVLVLVIVIIREPIKLLKDSFADLVDASPKKIIKERVYNITTRVISDQCSPVRVKNIRMRRAGRKLFIYLVCHADDRLTSYDLLKLEKAIAEYPLEHFSSVDVRAFIE